MPDTIDVYLLAGQSNMSGYGKAEEVPAALALPHPAVRMYFVPLNEPGHERLERPGVRQWMPLGPGCGTPVGGFGPELSLGHTLANTAGRPIALIKADRGGTSLFAHWRPADHDDATTLTSIMLAAAADAWEALLEEGLSPRLAGLVWFQGESDTGELNPVAHRYRQQLTTLLERVGDELADGEAFAKVMIRINPPPQDDRPHIESIRTQLVALAEDDPHGAWIDVDGLSRVEGDPLHFNGPALLTLGDLAARTLLPLLPPTPDLSASQKDHAASTPEVKAESPPPPDPRSPDPDPRSPTPVLQTPDPRPQTPPNAPRILALMNQKGGVGKTTTAVNVGAALANLGLAVLCIDLDPQAHLTLSLGLEPDDIDKSNYDLLTDPDTTAMETVRYTARDDKRLAVLPAETNLAGIESELSEMIATGLAQTILRNKCKDLVKQFDYVLIDCPPSLGLLTINALTMASEIVVPMQAHFLALQGMSKLFETIGMVRQGINPDLTVAGVVLCMHEGNTLLANEVIGELEGFFEAARGTDQPWANGKVFQPPVRRNIKLAEAPSFGQSVHAYAPDSNGAKDYLALARSIAGGG